MARYLKAVVAFVVPVIAAAVYALQAALTDGRVSSDEWVVIIVGVAAAVLTAAGVYATPNKPAA